MGSPKEEEPSLAPSFPRGSLFSASLMACVFYTGSQVAFSISPSAGPVPTVADSALAREASTLT